MDKAVYRRILPLLDVSDEHDYTVLHLECGDGDDLKYMSTAIGKNSSFFGVDRSGEAIEHVDPEVAHDAKFHFLQYDIAKGIPFDYDFFDIVYGNNFLASIEDKDALVREIYRVSKDKARIILFEQDRDALAAILESQFFVGFVYACATHEPTKGYDGYVYVGNKL
ncbi:MAG: methyltransferase domain-containing protein [Spirochaetota bacterium]